MIDQRDEHCICVCANSFNSTSYRSAHLALRISIHCEAQVKVRELMLDILCTMSNDDNCRFDAGCSQIIDTMLDDGSVAEWQQRLERAHAARAPRSQQDCGDVIHAKIWSGVASAARHRFGLFGVR